MKRAGDIRRALRLELFTLGWNLVEAAVALGAAVAAGSVALFGFGIDSLVESLSAGVLLWRLGVERRGSLGAAEIERLDQRAHRLVGATLFALAAWVAYDATDALWHREAPEPSWVGIAVTSLSLIVMWWLARAKRRAATDLDSRALHADAFQTTACWWLSLIALFGIGANAAFGWWWADPVAAFGMIPFLVQEGREAWRGEDCGC